jgi:hypothetical protein
MEELNRVAYAHVVTTDVDGATSIRPTTRRTTPARSGMAKWSYYSVRAGLGAILTKLQGPWSRLWTKLPSRFLD